MKAIITALRLFLLIGVLGTVFAAEPPSSSPPDAIRGFYRWYVTELIANRQPLDNRSELKRFATERLLNQINKMRKGPDGVGADYFLDAQDFDNLWAKNISISNLKVNGRYATAEVRLTGKGEMRRTLKVSLVSDGATWKIDRVQGRE
jgi:hypothetical protein